jgi:hypothetical protein
MTNGFGGQCATCGPRVSKEHRALIARAETKIAEHATTAAEAGERAQAAKDRLERIRRGESVPGGLGKPFDVRAALKAAGLTERDLRRMRLLASLPERSRSAASAMKTRSTPTDNA